MKSGCFAPMNFVMWPPTINARLDNGLDWFIIVYLVRAPWKHWHSPHSHVIFFTFTEHDTMNACETKVTLEEMRIYGHQRANNLDVFHEYLANLTAKDKMAGYAGKYVSWDSFQLLILEKRLHEHMNRMERISGQHSIVGTVCCLCRGDWCVDKTYFSCTWRAQRKNGCFGKSSTTTTRLLCCVVTSSFWNSTKKWNSRTWAHNFFKDHKPFDNYKKKTKKKEYFLFDVMSISKILIEKLVFDNRYMTLTHVFYKNKSDVRIFWHIFDAAMWRLLWRH